jgi:hypothetical protein
LFNISEQNEKFYISKRETPIEQIESTLLPTQVGRSQVGLVLDENVPKSRHSQSLVYCPETDDTLQLLVKQIQH